MTTLTVTLDFASDDGTAEQFVQYYLAGDAWPDGSYDGGEGNPAGSVTSSISYPTAGFQIIGFSKSLLDWGVPAGATITAVGNLQCDYKAVKTGSYAYDPYPLVELRKGACVVEFGNIIAANYPPDPFAGIFDSWEALPQQDIADLSPFDTSSLVCLGIYLDGTADVSGSSISYWYDNIKFDIEYIAGIDVELVGSGTQRRQLGDGTLNIVDLIDCRLIGSGTQRRALGFGGISLNDEFLIYGSGFQRRQKGTGIIYSPIFGEVAEPVPSRMRFILKIDGLEYPMISAIVHRHRNYENASVIIPGAMMWVLLDTIPSLLEIQIQRTNSSGASETSTLFSGSIDLTKTSLSGMTGELRANGTAIYPARENRQLEGRPIYIRDSADQVAVRGRINPDLVPGDVLRFGDVWEISVNKIVYNLNRDLFFMEASSGL